MKRATLDAILALQEAKTGGVLLTDLGSGDQTLVRDGAADGDIAIDDTLREAIDAAVREDKGRTVEISTPSGSRQIFVQVFNPPLRMLIVGAVHIAQALAPMAAMLGYDVTIVDPRESFATTDRFPGVTLTHDWPDDAMAAFAPDHRSAIVTLTHDPKLDDPALDVALRSPAFYVGALGSRKTHGLRVERLKARGFDEAAIARIDAPVGLAIGAKSPAEIALSVMAQVTATLRRAPDPNP